MTSQNLRSSFLAALLVLATTTACSSALVVTGSGQSRTEPRAVANFTALSVAIPGRVEMVQGTTESLTLTADDNVIGLIETVVEGGVLKLRMTERNLRLTPRTPIRVQLNVKSLDAISIYGSGDVRAASFEAPKLTIGIFGSGDVELGKLTTQKLATKIRGSGDVVLAGRADNAEISIAGSGDVKASHLETRNIEVSIAGSGDAAVWARDTLSVSIAGSGDVQYYGDPSVDKKVLGSGSVKRRGASPS